MFLTAAQSSAPLGTRSASLVSATSYRQSPSVLTQEMIAIVESRTLIVTTCSRLGWCATTRAYINGAADRHRRKTSPSVLRGLSDVRFVDVTSSRILKDRLRGCITGVWNDAATVCPGSTFRFNTTPSMGERAALNSVSNT
jgi:hypothetical protein